MKYLKVLPIFLLLVVGCKDQSIDQKIDDLDISEAVQSKHPGKLLMEAQCYVCHKPPGEDKGRLAPPMKAVKNHYLKEGVSKEEFISQITKWVEEPSLKKSKMYGAVQRFGVMTKTEFKKEDVVLIAEYMYEHDLGNHHGKKNQRR